MKTKHLLPLLAALSLPATSHTATIVGASGGSLSLHFNSTQVIAQQFAISGNADLDSVTLDFTPGDAFSATLWLTDNLGIFATPADVITSATFTTPAAGGLLTIPLTASIGPGAYFIVVSTDSAGATRVKMDDAFGGGAVLDESFGVVDLAYNSITRHTPPYTSPFFNFDPAVLNFSVEGAFSGVHDPALARSFLLQQDDIFPIRTPDAGSPLLLLGMGLLICAALRCSAPARNTPSH